ncbi:Subtilisin-like protease SBT1.4, partial [Linum grandiflorum]
YGERSINESVESKSPKDTEGHETHTASTAGSSIVQNVSLFHYAAGEATEACIAAYKICWLFGCFNSDIFPAFDQAIQDRVDVISLSFGSSYASPYDADTIAIIAFSAAREGIGVSYSTGNNGPRAYTTLNIAPWIQTVGASTIDRALSPRRPLRHPRPDPPPPHHSHPFLPQPLCRLRPLVQLRLWRWRHHRHS